MGLAIVNEGNNQENDYICVTNIVGKKMNRKNVHILYNIGKPRTIGLTYPL